MNKEIILAEWNQTTGQLTTLLDLFTSEVFNRKPTATDWSAAQIAAHLLKVDNRTYQALKSETIPTNRPPDEKIALIKNAMLSDTKRVSPNVVEPAGEWQEPPALAAALQTQREAIAALIADLDLTEACRAYKHPVLGTLTRLEWVYFNIYHAGRHLRQMQSLLGKTIAG